MGPASRGQRSKRNSQFCSQRCALQFSSGLVGTAYLSPVVGAGPAALWSGWSAGKLAIRLARRNNDVREPKQRLWTLEFSGLLSAAGLILWGVGAARGVHWFGLIIRNTLGFAVSYGINPWINGMGLQNCFIAVAMVSLACTFTFIPMIFFGKELRKFSAKVFTGSMLQLVLLPICEIAWRGMVGSIHEIRSVETKI